MHWNKVPGWSEIVCACPALILPSSRPTAFPNRGALVGGNQTLQASVLHIMVILTSPILLSQALVLVANLLSVLACVLGEVLFPVVTRGCLSSWVLGCLLRLRSLIRIPPSSALSLFALESGE